MPVHQDLDQDYASFGGSGDGFSSRHAAVALLRMPQLQAAALLRDQCMHVGHGCGSGQALSTTSACAAYQMT